MPEDKCQEAAKAWKAILKDVAQSREGMQEIETLARENTAPTRVTFGTSGWRGETGNDFTFQNLRVVTTAIMEMLQSAGPELLKELGAGSYSEVRKKGVLVGHDNRFLGPDFAREVMGLLSAGDIRVYYAGEASTPELSAAVDRLGVSCSINLTPSHNPANWSGFKFNPADGGPAGTEITSVIEEKANALMQNPPPSAGVAAVFEKVDPISLYEEFLNARGTLDLDGIRDFVRDNDCLIVVDHIHGSTRGRPQRLLGQSEKLVSLRTEDDQLFGGIAPEPSARNMARLLDTLSRSSARFKLGVLMDPDGDRIRLTDGVRDITMNHFGAMVLHYLHRYKNIEGVLVKSVATSNFGNAIASALGIPIRETAVGFKNFRPYMLPSASERAIVSYEESDGISGYNNTLEKDALFGLLVAVEMMAATGKNIGTYLSELEEEFGAYFPERAGISVDRALAGPSLIEKLSRIRERCQVGSELRIGDAKRKVINVITLDGTKMVLDDGSWLLIRPSGTEPKVRFYVETRSPEEQKAMVATAESMVKEALS